MAEYNAAHHLTHLSQDYTSSVTIVSGTVSDLDEYGNPAELASVTVNGVAAEVGFGAFTAYDVPIALGENRLVAVATDLGGKVSQDEIVIQVTKSGDNFIGFGYDDNGNLRSRDDHGEVTSYYYDFENRLVRVVLPDETSNEFVYDGDLRRIGKKAADGTETGFLHDGLNILQDLDGDNNIKAAYLQGIGIDKLIARTEWVTETETAISYYHSDALGSVRAMTAADESEVKTYAYDAWGKVTAETGTSSNEYKFTSRRWEEEIGLQYNRARFYDPEIGRFITRDPLTGGPDDPTISYFSGVYSQFHRFLREHIDSLQPHKLNRYVYCNNNPVNLIDPLGLYEEDVHSTLETLLNWASGFTLADSLSIARANQSRDEGRNRAWLRVLGGGGNEASRLWHFTTPERRAEIYAEAVENKSHNVFGYFKHAFEDSYSHQEGETDIVPGTEYSPERGHLRDGTAPDHTWRRPELANRMAEGSYNVNIGFQRDIGYESILGVDYEKIRNFVDAFNRALPEDKNQAAQNLGLAIYLEKRRLREEAKNSSDNNEVEVEVPQTSETSEYDRNLHQNATR